MDAKSVARVASKIRRSESIEIGGEAGLRPHHALSLAGKDRQEARELLDRASFLFPSCSERRGEYLKRHARSL